MKYRKSIRCTLALLLIALLCGYLLAIVLCNFWLPTYCYESDMYSDMLYAKCAWESKSIFPDRWAFGNQLYAVATPNLAALFYGLTSDPQLAMGIASTCMSIFILLSLCWMLKPMGVGKLEQLFAAVMLLSITLAAGDPVWSWHGWQLLFTICSYYSCYLITAFLAVGCYLRYRSQWSWKQWAMLILTCLLSFGTGIQSLRQTAIMTCPLIAVEFLRCLWCWSQKETIFSRATLVTATVTVSNLFGVLWSKTLNLSMTAMYGNIQLAELSAIPERLSAAVNHAGSLFSMFTDPAAAFVLCGILWCWFFWKFLRTGNILPLLCLLFFTISPAVILVMDVATTMNVRHLYYFMLYPLVALLLSYLFSHSGTILRCAAILFLAFLLNFNHIHRTATIPHEPNTFDAYSDAVQCLEENGITAVFGVWNSPQYFAIASDFRLGAGNWGVVESPFHCAKYLCDTAVFNTPASQCAYVFRPEELVIAEEIIQSNGIEWEELAYLPEHNMYLYVSDTALMSLYQ